MKEVENFRQESTVQSAFLLSGSSQQKLASDCNSALHLYIHFQPPFHVLEFVAIIEIVFTDKQKCSDQVPAS